MKFSTTAVLQHTTERYLCDLDGLYAVASYLVGRPVCTHELVIYGGAIEKAIQAVRPDLPTKNEVSCLTKDNFRAFVAECEAKFGKEIDLPDSLRECLADDKTPMETMKEHFPNVNVRQIRL